MRLGFIETGSPVMTMKKLVKFAAIVTLAMFACEQGAATGQGILEPYNDPEIMLPVVPVPVEKPVMISRTIVCGFFPPPLTDWTLRVPGGAIGIRGDSTRSILVLGHHTQSISLPIYTAACGLLGIILSACFGGYLFARRRHA